MNKLSNGIWIAANLDRINCLQARQPFFANMALLIAKFAEWLMVY